MPCILQLFSALDGIIKVQSINRNEKGKELVDFIFEPLVGVGDLKFGMLKSEVESLKTKIGGIGYCCYQDGKLSAFTIDPDDIENLIFFSKDVLELDKLSAALYIASQSTDYGQAQGGSLYFMDLGCALLQFESSLREFLFFSKEYLTGEPLRDMTPSTIESYYREQIDC